MASFPRHSVRHLAAGRDTLPQFLASVRFRAICCNHFSRNTDAHKKCSSQIPEIQSLAKNCGKVSPSGKVFPRLNLLSIQLVRQICHLRVYRRSYPHQLQLPEMKEHSSYQYQFFHLASLASRTPL